MLPYSIVNRLENDADWKHLQGHIQECIASLDSLAGINFLDKEAAAIEGRSRELSRQVLTAILEPFAGQPELTENKKTALAKKTGVL